MILLLSAIFTAGVISHPTSCTEDSQCPSGFFCEESAHFCLECLSCDDLERESLLPSDVCAKSVLDCGACFKGLVESTPGNKIDRGGACAPPEAPPGAGGPLPPHAWLAIAASLLLMLIIVCVFTRTNTFKIIALASRTSVQSVRRGEPATAPPPYNDLDPLPLRPVRPHACADATEVHRLMEFPPVFEKPIPSESMVRPCEASASQAARVYNNPAYVRVPQNQSRCHTPEAPMLIQQITESNEVSPEDRSVVNTSGIKINNNHKEDKEPEAASSGCNNNESPLFTKTREDTQSQDTNNNFSVLDGSPSSRHQQSYRSHMHAGASFVINVVENINNIQQRNDVTF